MAENTASEERSFAFMFLEIRLIENENGCPVNLVITTATPPGQEVDEAAACWLEPGAVVIGRGTNVG
jgi:hypothetical protein